MGKTHGGQCEGRQASEFQVGTIGRRWDEKSINGHSQLKCVQGKNDSFLDMNFKYISCVWCSSSRTCPYNIPSLFHTPDLPCTPSWSTADIYYYNVACYYILPASTIDSLSPSPADSSAGAVLCSRCEHRLDNRMLSRAYCSSAATTIEGAVRMLSSSCSSTNRPSAKLPFAWEMFERVPVASVGFGGGCCLKFRHSL